MMQLTTKRAYLNSICPVQTGVGLFCRYGS